MNEELNNTVTQVNDGNTVSEPTVTPSVNPAPVVEPTPAPVEAPTPVAEPTPVEAPTPVVEPTPVETPAPAVTPVETPAPVENTPVATVTPEVTPAPVDNAPLASAPEAPIGETNTPINPPPLDAPVEETTKKSKKGIFIALIIVLIVLAVGGLIAFSQFGTSKSRIKSIANAIFTTENYQKIKNEFKNQQSGTYKFTVNGKLALQDQDPITGNLEVKGNYGYDLPNKDMYATLSVDKMNYASQELLGSTGLNSSLDISKDTLYFQIKEVYDKVLFIKDDTFLELFEELEKALESSNNTESIDVNKVIIAVRDAFAEGLSAPKSSQSVTSVDGIGTTNVITIVLNKSNKELITKTILNKLADSDFPKEIAKVTGNDAATIKDSLKERANSYEADDETETLYIYTSLFGNNLEGIRVTKPSDKDDCGKGKPFDGFITIKDNTLTYKFTDPNQASGTITVKLENKGTKTDIVVSAKVTEIISKRNYNSEGSIDSCTEIEKEIVTVDFTMTTTNTESEKGIEATVKVGTEVACKEKDSCTAEKNTFELSLSENMTIDKTYVPSSMVKDNAVDVNELTEADQQIIMQNIQNNFSVLSELLSSLFGDSSRQTMYDDYDFESYYDDYDYDYNF